MVYEKSQIKRSKRVFLEELPLIDNKTLVKNLLENRFWCSIDPSSSTINGVTVTQTNDFVEIINEWLCENCEGSYMYSSAGEGVNYTISGNLNLHISFEKPSDAMHFKLRWAGE